MIAHSQSIKKRTWVSFVKVIEKPGSFFTYSVIGRTLLSTVGMLSRVPW
jgi:hypothetical protein